MVIFGSQDTVCCIISVLCHESAGLGLFDQTVQGIVLIGDGTAICIDHFFDLGSCRIGNFGGISVGIYYCNWVAKFVIGVLGFSTEGISHLRQKLHLIVSKLCAIA